MVCGSCRKNLGSRPILAVGEMFCSDICHLKFWQREMPNMGGNWITDEMLRMLGGLKGKDRKEQYREIKNFIMNNFESTSLIHQLAYNDPSLEEGIKVKGDLTGH